MRGATTTYVALVRGINVGSRAQVAMADLRAVVAGLGHEEVRTHLRSGNVVFTTAGDRSSSLSGGIESAIARSLGVRVRVIVRTAGELAEVAARNPFVPAEGDFTKLHVSFLAETPDRAKAARLSAPAGVGDELSVVGREVYLHTPGGYARTKIGNDFVERRLGVAATARGWKTVLKLVELAGPGGRS